MMLRNNDASRTKSDDSDDSGVHIRPQQDQQQSNVDQTQIPLKKRQPPPPSSSSSSSSSSSLSLSSSSSLSLSSLSRDDKKISGDSGHEDDEPDSKIVDELSTEGYLVWAKIKGFSYWPGVTTVDPYEGVTVKRIGEQRRKCHVHFLAYDNLRAWVPESNIMPYEGYAKFKEMAFSAKRKQDFEPGKKFQNIFDRAVKEAERIIHVPIQDRLPKLGFVYVLIHNNKDGGSGGERKKETEKMKRKSIPQKTSSTKNGEAPPKKKPKQPKKTLYASQTHIKSNNNNNNNNNNNTDVYEFTDDEDDDDDDEVDDNNIDKETDKELLSDDDSDEPKLGSLIWGRMVGFPYWPCFVTRNPSTGEYVRTKSNKRSFHVQFFNWNDESGWVTKTMPWCSVDEYRRKAKRALALHPHANLEWNPVGKMLHKWKNAVLEADGTANLSRKERHNRYLVLYKTGKTKSRPLIKSTKVKTLLTPVAASTLAPMTIEHHPLQPIVEKSPKLPPGWVIHRFDAKKRREYQSPDGVVFNKIADAIAYLFQQNGGPTWRKRSYSESFLPSRRRPIKRKETEDQRRPCPASRKHKEGRGWFLVEGDRSRYPMEPLRPLTRYLDLDDRIEYKKDTSLPKDWSVQYSRTNKSEKRTTYISPEVRSYSKSAKTWPERKKFGSKVAVASYLEGMGHPALELEHLITVAVHDDDNNDDDDDDNNYDDVVVNKDAVTVRVKENEPLSVIAAKDPKLAKMASMQYIDVVPLPRVVLKHPSVIVVESGNEEIISDIHTGEFIAKKIMYG